MLHVNIEITRVYLFRKGNYNHYEPLALTIGVLYMFNYIRTFLSEPRYLNALFRKDMFNKSWGRLRDVRSCRFFVKDTAN